jgi:predicted GNAT family acetyltransferase
VIAEHFVLERVRAFVSYTAENGNLFQPWPQVVIDKTVDERCYPLFTTQGLAQDEVAHYFANGKAHSFTLYQDRTHQNNEQISEPVAACLSYQNFEQVYEIGGVFTIDSERRKGHARKIVETALHTLLQAGCIPRYQVHKTNLPSIHLAETLGLQPFVVMKHWLHSAA